MHAKPNANRKNYIDNFVRKNVSQYAYGLVALGRQLFSLGLSDIPKVDSHNSIANALRDMYQNMGDASNWNVTLPTLLIPMKIGNRH